MADGLFTTGATKLAIDQYRRGLDILENLDRSGNRSIAGDKSLHRGYLRLCNYLLVNGDHRSAIENCQKSTIAAQRLVAGNPADTVSRAALAASYGQTGNALRIDKRLNDAIPQIERAASEFHKLSLSQPNNNSFASNLAGSRAILGNCYSDTGDLIQALQSYEKSIETVRTMIQIDPVDVRPKTTLGFSLIRSADVLLKLGRSGKARAAATEGLAIFRIFADRTGATQEDLNNFASFLNDMKIPELQQPRLALTYAKRAVSATKEPSLALLSTLTDAYYNTGNLDSAITTARRALNSYPAPQAGREAGLRADLAKKLKDFYNTKFAASLR